MTGDTSEIQFFMRDSEAFKKLIRENHLTLLDSMKDGICSPPDGGHYLFAIEKRVETIEFYVHEFTEFVLRPIIMQELQPYLKGITDDKIFYFNFNAGQIAHLLSQETEGDKVW
ncbi:MAG: hypothetical protein ABR909_07775 [Candidatus Bathyarchaeia archaeon]|jgi:hypothetical protein